MSASLDDEHILDLKKIFLTILFLLKGGFFVPTVPKNPRILYTDSWISEHFHYQFMY